MQNVGAAEDNQQAANNPADDNESIGSSYQMVSDIFDFNELKDLDNFYIKRYRKNNATYKGQISLETKKREGLGVLIYDDGRFYEGAWLKDKRNG